jgi:hypothetical protein
VKRLLMPRTLGWLGFLVQAARARPILLGNL